MKYGIYLKRNSKRIKKKAIAFILIFAVAFSVFIFNLRVAELIRSYAGSEAKGFANTVVNGIMSDYFKISEISYSDVVHIANDGNGQVTSVQFDSIELAKIKSDVSGKVQNYADGNRNTEFNIPIGTISKITILNGLGPCIGIKAQKSVWVEAQVYSVFSEAGINQTLHKLFLSVTVHSSYISAFIRCSEAYTVDYPFAETIIVGKVPESYTNVVSGEELAGMISDYS